VDELIFIALWVVHLRHAGIEDGEKYKPDRIYLIIAKQHFPEKEVISILIHLPLRCGESDSWGQCAMQFAPDPIRAAAHRRLWTGIQVSSEFTAPAILLRGPPRFEVLITVVLIFNNFSVIIIIVYKEYL
jgi:hypothetical protein